jgi:N-acetylmuramic acid 6-phosphate etherase
MVDLRASNQKLQDRAVRIIATLTGLAAHKSNDLLRAADGHVKLAVVMHERAVGVEQAKELLAAAGGNLRAAIGR